MNIIKRFLRKLYAKRTGRTCACCAHNCGGKCKRPYEQFMACWHSITRPGFEYACSMHIEGRCNEEAIAAPGDMTEEEKYQMGKIVETLQEASETAQDAGLLDNEYI